MRNHFPQAPGASSARIVRLRARFCATLRAIRRAARSHRPGLTARAHVPQALGARA